MDYQPWMDYITIDDMPNDDLKTVAEHAGIRTAITLLFCAPGLTVNVPKEGFRSLKERYIMQNYDGTKYSINNLAIACNLSQRYIYQIIKRNISKKASFVRRLPDNLI